MSPAYIPLQDTALKSKRPFPNTTPSLPWVAAGLELVILQKFHNLCLPVTLCIALDIAYRNSNFQTHLNDYMLCQLIDGNLTLVKTQYLLQLCSQHTYVSLNASNPRLFQISSPLR